MERTRRLRTSNYMRDMVRENHVRIDELIYPIFVTEGERYQFPGNSKNNTNCNYKTGYYAYL